MKRRKSRLIVITPLVLSLVIIYISVVWSLRQAAKKDKLRKDTSEVVKLLVWDIPKPGATEALEKAERAVYLDFKEQYPGINVMPKTGLRASHQEGDRLFLMAQAGNIAPDVITNLSARSVREYIKAGFLLPLNEYIGTWQGKDMINEQTIPAIGDASGNIYAVPKGFTATGLYYRKDLFRKAAKELRAAGLSPDRAPKDWEEFYQYARILSVPAENEQEKQFGLGIWWGFDAGYWWTNLVWQAGGDMIKKYKYCPSCNTRLEARKEDNLIECTSCGADVEDMKEEWTAAFNEGPGLEAMQFLKKLVWAEIEVDGQVYERAIAKYDRAGEIYDDFRDGKIAMIFRPAGVGLVGAQAYDPAVTGMAMLPVGPSGKPINMLNMELFGINAHLKDKAQIDAAWKYIEHLTSDRAEQIRTRIFVESGLAKYVRPDHLRKFGYEEYLDTVETSWVQVQDNLFKYGRMEPFAPGYKSVQTKVLQEAIEAVVYDKSADPQAALDRSAAKANSIFTSIPIELVAKRRRIANYVAMGVLLIVIVVILKFRRILSSILGSSSAIAGDGSVARKKIRFTPWIFMAPALGSILLWAYVPLIRGALMAFQDYRIMGGSKWVWLDNFISIFTDPSFYMSMMRTFYYVGLTLSLGFFTPIVLALLLSEVPRGKTFFRVMFYLPAVTSGIVIMLMWKNSIFEPSSAGLLNTFLGYLGVAPQKWLKDSSLAMLCVVLPGVWASVGPGSIIYLAALKSVPDELYEHAAIDGAGTWFRIWNVTIPTLKPLIIINFVGAFIGSFRAMQNIYVMTEGGPAGATHIVGIEVFEKAFIFLKFGYATAIGWILGFMLIGFTIHQLRILKRVRFTAAAK